MINSLVFYDSILHHHSMENRYLALKKAHREIRDHSAPEVRLRIHRALSWLKVSEITEDLDTRFLHLWISFNAVYAREFDLDMVSPERALFHTFLTQVCELDNSKRIHQMAWDNYSNRIRVFVNNRYVFGPFWQYQQGRLSNAEWERLFESSKRLALQALAEEKTAIFLTILFDRLYTLRNQLIHGGATWNSKMNREQLDSAVRILHDFAPELIQVIMDNPDVNWGEPQYPVVDREH